MAKTNGTNRRTGAQYPGNNRSSRPICSSVAQRTQGLNFLSCRVRSTWINQKSMKLKNSYRPLRIAAFAIGVCFIANSATPYGVNQRPDYQPAPSKQRIVPSSQASFRTSASYNIQDLSSSEFTIRGGAKLAGSREARPQKERGDPESLVLIGLGFMLFGCAVLIRRGSTA